MLIIVFNSLSDYGVDQSIQDRIRPGRYKQPVQLFQIGCDMISCFFGFVRLCPAAFCTSCSEWSDILTIEISFFVLYITVRSSSIVTILHRNNFSRFYVEPYTTLSSSVRKTISQCREPFNHAKFFECSWVYIEPFSLLKNPWRTIVFKRVAYNHLS